MPIVTRETEKVALADKYNALAGKASCVGLLGKDDANIQQYVTGKALVGLYLMIGEEERKFFGKTRLAPVVPPCERCSARSGSEPHIHGDRCGEPPGCLHGNRCRSVTSLPRNGVAYLPQEDDLLGDRHRCRRNVLL